MSTIRAVSLDTLYRFGGPDTRSHPRLTANTDGADTIRSSHIQFTNWTVDNGDDSISFKGNSTDISVRDSNFYNGLGIAIGSVGRYDGEYEVIQGVTVENVTFHATTHAVCCLALSWKGFLPPPFSCSFATDIV